MPTKRGAVAPFRKHKQVSLVLCLFLFSLLSFSAFAQTKVTGRVSSGDTSLSDVTVQVKGTTTGTSTNAEGKFSIDAPANATLVFSHINYAAMEIGVNNRTTINVVLTSNNATLTDVVVVGYNSQRKATLTGSISTVKGADLVKSPQPNVSNSLAGRFSGMIINNRGGEPGYDGSAIYIRGLATTGNNDVLIVVDGVPGQIGGLERLNPNDIESLTVLKDASAAIYGSRAANGVILITTKRGRSGKPMISASFNQGFSSPTRLPKMADAATYATIMNEITYYTNKAGGMNQQYSATELQKFADGSDPLNYANTDWADLTLKKSAAQSQANVSVNGGSENIRYYVSAGALYQDGIYKNGATKYKQYSFRSNIDANITKGFKVALYLSGREENRQFPMVSAGSIFRSIYRAFPTVPAFFPNGLPSYGIEGSNPPVMATDIGGLNKNPTQVFNGVLKGSYDIAPVKGLSIDGFYAIDKLWSFSKAFSQPYILYKYDRTTDVYSKQVMGGANQLATLSESQRNQSQTTANIKLNFKRGFGGHNIDAFVGYEQSEFKAEEFGAYRENFPSTQTPELSQGGAAAADKNNYGGSYHYTRKSYLGKLGYNYHDKYLAEVQMRIDGSSIFPKGNQYGYFPSVSAGWRISKESFFNVGFIDDLKLRASYGQLGNDNVELFQYLNNYSLNSQLVLGSNVVSGIDLTKLANEKITWETARKTDIGLEAVILKKFFIELIYFQQKRSDILTKRNASIPFVTGIVNPYGSSSLVPDENIGKVDSKGFEATLGYNNKTRNGFSYGISGNITYAKSKVIFLDEASGMLAYQRREGHPLNTYVLYNAIGIFRTDDDLSKYKQVNGNGNQLGDLIYEDYNKDGKISADDQVRTKYGNIPEITYGVLLNAGYKNFDIVAVFSGQTNVSQYVLPESGNVGNFYSSWADNRWSPTNTAGSYPRVDTRASASVNGGQYPNTFWLNDASFIRLKNVELGYNLSPEWLKRTKMEGFRVYLNAFNLFTITKVKDYDPEGSNGSGQFYPQQRIINVGVNV
ncbi:MAG TPA: TonB-dependent receptor, partial [Chitinophagaceae bacterium]|nr:TonB-dependent receptor [Chitinophagaceae bacterium]